MIVELSFSLSILPPVAVKDVSEVGEADVHPECIGGDHGGGSPILVLVNSKSGENQGMRILSKFKRLLNPSQVVDIIADGPEIGYFLYRIGKELLFGEFLCRESGFYTLNVLG